MAATHPTAGQGSQALGPCASLPSLRAEAALYLLDPQPTCPHSDGALGSQVRLLCIPSPHQYPISSDNKLYRSPEECAGFLVEDGGGMRMGVMEGSVVNLRSG